MKGGAGRKKERKKRGRGRLPTFGTCQELSGPCIPWNTASNVNQVGLDVQQGHVMLQGALSSSRQALEGFTGLQAPRDHLTKPHARA